jgi:hypothetical protein
MSDHTNSICNFWNEEEGEVRVEVARIGLNADWI